MSRIIVLGGGYAGLMAAERIGRKHQVTLVNGDDSFVERIRLHEVASGKPARRHPIRRMLRGTGVEFVQGWAQVLDPHTRTVTVHTPAGPATLSYDILVYALGSTPNVYNVPGADAHAYRLTASGPRSAQALAERARELAARSGRMVVVGGGLTGIEAAAEFAETYPNLRVWRAS